MLFTSRPYDEVDFEVEAYEEKMALRR